MAGKPYQELYECETVEVREFLVCAFNAAFARTPCVKRLSCSCGQVSCLRDLIKSTSSLTYYWRTLGLKNCSRSFVGSPTVDVDQQNWDSWLADWQQAYELACAGVLAEVAWDVVEFFAYMIL